MDSSTASCTHGTKRQRNSDSQSQKIWTNGLDSASSSSKGNKPEETKRRKIEEDVTSELMLALLEAFKKFITMINDKLSAIVQKIGYEHDLAAQRQQVYAALSAPAFAKYNTMQHIKAALGIASEPRKMQLFFSLPEEERKVLVSMVLEDKI